MSLINYKPQIRIGDEWLGNTQVFATRKEAEHAAFRMLDAWSEASDYRALPTIEPVNSHLSMSDDTNQQGTTS